MKRFLRLAAATLTLMLGWNAGALASDVVVVVSAHSSVRELSPNQIADIFLGRTRRFPNGERAVPIDQQEGSAAHQAFYSEYVGMSAAQVRANWSKILFTGRGQPPAQLESGAEVKKRIAEDPNAIGYVERNQVDASLRVIAER
jgi:ABC-type phosphate transport system substrate-binding protein